MRTSRFLQRATTSVVASSLIFLSALALSGLAGCTPGNDEDLTPAMETALEDFCYLPAHSEPWWSALDLLRDAEEKSEGSIRPLLGKYAPALSARDSNDAFVGVKARALLYVLAQMGDSEQIAEYLAPGCDSAVLYALAESRGLICYYNFVESGQYDTIVPPRKMIIVMIHSPLFSPWREALVAWKDSQ